MRCQSNATRVKVICACAISIMALENGRSVADLFEDNAKLRKELASVSDRSQEENAQLRREIQSLKQDLTCLRAYITDLPPLSISVDKYDSLKRNDESHTSRAFYTHPRGYKMCVKIWPNGVLDGKDSHVSVACHIMRGERDADLKWPFCGNVYIRLVNQRRDHHHCDHFIRYTHRTPRSLSGRVSRCACAKGPDALVESSQGNYIVRFIAHSSLVNSATGTYHLLNNTLQFVITKVELR